MCGHRSAGGQAEVGGRVARVAHVVVRLARLVVEVVHLRVIRGRRLVVVRVLVVVLVVPEVVRLVVRHVTQRVVGSLRCDGWRRRRHYRRVGAQRRQVARRSTSRRARARLAEARVQVGRVRVQVAVVLVAQAQGSVAQRPQETLRAVLADLLLQLVLLLLLLLVLLVQRGGLDVALGQTRVQTRVRVAAARRRVVEGRGRGNLLFTNHIDRRTDRRRRRDGQDGGRGVVVARMAVVVAVVRVVVVVQVVAVVVVAVATAVVVVRGSCADLVVSAAELRGPGVRRPRRVLVGRGGGGVGGPVPGPVRGPRRRVGGRF